MSSNVTKFLRFPRIILILFGVWPSDHRTMLTKIYGAFVIFEQYVFLLFNGVFIYMMRGDVRAMSDASYLFFTQLALCCRSTAFFLNRKEIRKVLTMMDDDIFKPQSDEHEKILKKYANKCRNLYIVLITCFSNNVTWWTVSPLFNRHLRMYPYNEIWFPVDRQKSPQYELAYIYEVAAIISSGGMFLSIDTFSVTTMLFTCAQLDILKEKMKKIQPVHLKLKQKEKEELIKQNNKFLVEFIKHHQVVQRFVETIQDALHFPIFFHLCTAVLIICIIALRLSQDSPTNPSFYGILNYFIMMLSQLYLYCWSGSELTEKSLQFRSWLYELPWYEQGAAFGATLGVLLACTRNPLVFRAGRYVLLTRTTFVSILRCSYSYFAVLQQANE